MDKKSTKLERLKKMKELQENWAGLPEFIREMNIIVHNDLPFLPQDFSIYQKRIIAYSMALIKKSDREKDTFQLSKTKFSIHAIYFEKAFNIKNGSGRTYIKLKEAIDDLFEKMIVLKGKTTLHKIRWLQDIKYIENEGKIELNFSEEIAKYLTMLSSGNYYKYNLFLSHSLSSIYSIRIFELLQKRKDTNTIYMSFDKFKEVLDIPAKYEKPFNIRTNILKRVKKELNDLYNMEFDCLFKKDKTQEGGYRVILTAKKNNDDLVKMLNFGLEIRKKREKTKEQEAKEDLTSTNSKMVKQDEEKLEEKYFEKHSTPEEEIEKVKLNKDLLAKKEQYLKSIKKEEGKEPEKAEELEKVEEVKKPEKDEKYKVIEIKSHEEIPF